MRKNKILGLRVTFSARSVWGHFNRAVPVAAAIKKVRLVSFIVKSFFHADKRAGETRHPRKQRQLLGPPLDQDVEANTVENNKQDDSRQHNNADSVRGEQEVSR